MYRIGVTYYLQLKTRGIRTRSRKQTCLQEMESAMEQEAIRGIYRCCHARSSPTTRRRGHLVIKLKNLQV
jgi:hypothetical protein